MSLTSNILFGHLIYCTWYFVFSLKKKNWNNERPYLNLPTVIMQIPPTITHFYLQYLVTNEEMRERRSGVNNSTIKGLQFHATERDTRDAHRKMRGSVIILLN